MRLSSKKLIVFFIVLFGALLLATKTKIQVCEVCGVQSYERSLFGMPIEWMSEYEIDELGSYKKWQQENDTIHNPHIWKEVDAATKELLTH